MGAAAGGAGVVLASPAYLAGAGAAGAAPFASSAAAPAADAAALGFAATAAATGGSGGKNLASSTLRPSEAQAASHAGVTAFCFRVFMVSFFFKKRKHEKKSESEFFRRDFSLETTKKKSPKKLKQKTQRLTTPNSAARANFSPLCVGTSRCVVEARMHSEYLAPRASPSRAASFLAAVGIPEAQSLTCRIIPPPPPPLLPPKKSRSGRE